MSRRLRYVPEGGSLVEITSRTLHSRFLLRPGRALDEIIVGVLGRAQRLYEVRCCGYLFLSSHYHLLLDVDNARQLSRFMCYVNSNLAREVSRLHGWKEKIWSRRYQAIPVSGEEEAQIARLRYLLSNGCKEGLVARPQDWPGVHAARALIQGEDLTGLWYDRTREYAARNRGEDFDPHQYATLETLHLSPLPCWKYLPAEVWRHRALDLIDEIAEEAAVRRSRTGSEPLGAAAILGQHPYDRPKHPKRSPAPLFHTVSAKVRRELWEAYRWFVETFRQAAEKLRAGDRGAAFPVGSFPRACPLLAGDLFQTSGTHRFWRETQGIGGGVSRAAIFACAMPPGLSEMRVFWFRCREEPPPPSLGEAWRRLGGGLASLKVVQVGGPLLNLRRFAWHLFRHLFRVADTYSA